MVHSITHPCQLLWSVEAKRQPGVTGRRKKNKATIKNVEVFPCRIASDQEKFRWGLETAERICVQFIGIHHKHKEQAQAVGASRLFRFDGVRHVPFDNGLPSDEACVQMQLSEEHLELYRKTLQRFKLSPVEQWMEVIMVQRMYQFIHDKVVDRIRAQHEEAARRAAPGDNLEDDAAAQYLAAVMDRPIQQQEETEETEECYNILYGRKNKEKLRVGDVIHYFPPELMAVESNLVKNATIIGIDPKRPLCVALDNGRGLGKDVRIIRVSLRIRNKLVPVEQQYECEIQEYLLVKGGDMVITGFGGMQREAKALVAAQKGLKAQIEKEFGAEATDGMCHRMNKKRETESPTVKNVEIKRKTTVKEAAPAAVSEATSDMLESTVHDNRTGKSSEKPTVKASLPEETKSIKPTQSSIVSTEVPNHSPMLPASKRKRRNSEAFAKVTSSRTTKARRTSLIGPSDKSTNIAPLATSRTRQITLHLTREQMELADEVMRIMTQRWGNDFSFNLISLERELGLESYEDRLQKFLTKDEHKLVRRAVHAETEGYLRDWLQSQRVTTSAANTIVHQLSPEEISI